MTFAGLDQGVRVDWLDGIGDLDMRPRRSEEAELPSLDKMSATTKAKGTALITGASSGIGAIYADRLARRGYSLIVVARNRNRLAALARRLEDETGRSVEMIAADLNDKTDLARIETTLRTNASVR